MAVPKSQYGVGEVTMNLTGKTPEQLDTMLAHKSRSELIKLIHSLVTVEILLKPAEIAARSCINKRAVLKDIRDGRFGDYYCRAENSIAVAASGVNQWRRSFRVPVNAGKTNTKNTIQDLAAPGEKKGHSDEHRSS
jgi:hypothetical protein